MTSKRTAAIIEALHLAARRLLGEARHDEIVAGYRDPTLAVAEAVSATLSPEPPAATRSRWEATDALAGETIRFRAGPLDLHGRPHGDDRDRRGTASFSPSARPDTSNEGGGA